MVNAFAGLAVVVELAQDNFALILVAVSATILFAAVIAFMSSKAPVHTSPFGPGKAIDRLKWRYLQLVDAEDTSHNTRRLVFGLDDDEDLSQMCVGRHITVGAEIRGVMVKRPYTPISMPDTKGRIELLIKGYTHGAMSSHLLNLPVGDRLGFRGPIGIFKYEPNHFRHVLMLAAGTGLTPMLQILKCACANSEDKTMFTLFFQNREERDILLREQLQELSSSYPTKVRIVLYLSRAPSEHWWSEPLGQREGYITKDHMDAELFDELKSAPPESGKRTPDAGQKILLCGPSGFCERFAEMATSECGVLHPKAIHTF
jgi:cytochrome-b5 reductase